MSGDYVKYVLTQQATTVLSMAAMTLMSVFFRLTELTTVTCKSRIGKPHLTFNIFNCLNLQNNVTKKLTSPMAAETRNLTQSSGVSPGFFFSGCVGMNNQLILSQQVTF